MNGRLRCAALLACSALAVGGCGGSSSSSSTTQPTSTSSTSAGLASVSTSSTASTTHHTSRRASHTTRHSTGTTTAAPASTATATPPNPIGTAPAPDGLRSAAGYVTYELCAGACSGAVPGSLRRALHLPQLGAGSSCPVSAGSGPVKPEGSSQLAVMPFVGSAWEGARVAWTSSADYTGPVLIRGRQLGGSGAVGFGEGHVPYDELQLLASGQQAPPAPGGGRSWLTFTRVRGPGCYADQVDGTNFSSVIVFRAVG